MERVSSYLEYLPAIFQEDPFVGQLLLAFERILTGPKQQDDPFPEQPGLEEYVDRLSTYLAPQEPASKEEAPAEFLPWLASWVALSLRDDWKEDFKRSFMRKVVSLYRKRGTKQGLQELLHMFTEETVTIEEFDEPPYYFQVTLTLGYVLNFTLKQTIARDIIDREKPAHSFYNLRFTFLTMQIQDTYWWPKEATRYKVSDYQVKGLRVGWNTIIGTESKERKNI